MFWTVFFAVVAALIFFSFLPFIVAVIRTKEFWNGVAITFLLWMIYMAFTAP